jgi:hypothetical protein
MISRPFAFAACECLGNETLEAPEPQIINIFFKCPTFHKLFKRHPADAATCLDFLHITFTAKNQYRNFFLTLGKFLGVGKSQRNVLFLSGEPMLYLNDDGTRN